MALTKRRQRFKDLYLTYFNATRAAREAGFANPGRYGSALLKEPDIKEAIEEALAEVHMGKDEVLKLQADIARGDIGSFIMDDGSFDFKKARAAGLMKLVKKIRQKVVNDKIVLEVEMYPADVAQERIMRVHGLFKDNLNLSGSMEIVVKKVGIDTEKL